jgi:hypothetical protein
LPVFVRSDGSGAPVLRTVVRLGADRGALFVHFECEDRDIWGTYRERDDPLYEQEAVEVFLAPGEADPVEYYEIEVSPAGVLFDASVRNPHGRREDPVTDPRWNCPGIRWEAAKRPDEDRWAAAIEIPWSGIGASSGAPPICRANFYRIERPRTAEPEFSAWSPTHADPPDFHKPRYFGRLLLESKETE